MSGKKINISVMHHVDIFAHFKPSGIIVMWSRNVPVSPKYPRSAHTFLTVRIVEPHQAYYAIYKSTTVHTSTICPA